MLFDQAERSELKKKPDSASFNLDNRYETLVRSANSVQRWRLLSNMRRNTSSYIKRIKSSTEISNPVGKCFFDVIKIKANNPN